MDMMKAILDIENKAQEIENSIGSLSGDIRLETDKKIEELSKTADIEGDAQIEKFQKTIKAREDKEYNETKAEMKAALDLLEKKFVQNREKWIKDIVSEIIEGDKK